MGSEPARNGGGKQEVHLTGVGATTLITLYAKAMDSRSKHPILGDKKADELVRMIDYDFQKVRSPSVANTMVVRSKQLDEWIREFLSSNRDAVVLNLGCGLDARVLRIGPQADVSWFDLDLPEVIAERKKFYNETKRYRMLESSVTEDRWLDEIPKGRPVLTVAEGLFEYLSRDAVESLLNRLTERFAEGLVIFDVMNSYAIDISRSSLKLHDAGLKWAVDDIGEVDKMNPRLRRTAKLNLLTSRYLPVGRRVMLSSIQVAPRFRNLVCLLRYEF